MSQRNYTIGMAGHIDHGKTELTKALTGTNTDRLKEEKERRISIELGYAPLLQSEEQTISIIDAPGHEKFIRQMIAGVYSVDLVLLIVAADEGVMPQTKEHMEILHYLGIENVWFVISKVDTVEEEMLSIVEEDLREHMKQSYYHDQAIFHVDSVSFQGIKQLKDAITQHLESSPVKDQFGEFRLAVDQVFSIHGTGTVVRGTIMSGIVQEGEEVLLLPSNNRTQVKTIRQFSNNVSLAKAGSRTALSLRNLQVNEIKRGEVVTSNLQALATRRVDLELRVSPYLDKWIKQRSPIKLHVNTSEAYGRIVFFDRNRVEEPDELLYVQVELDDPIYVHKGDRFVLRRATPVETIGGGRIIVPQASKHKFGMDTVEWLKERSEASLEEQILLLIEEDPGIDFTKLKSQFTSSLSEVEDKFHELQKERIVQIDYKLYTVNQVKYAEDSLIRTLTKFHESNPMKKGLNKSEVIQSLPYQTKREMTLLHYFIDQEVIEQSMHYIYLKGFSPYVPDNLKEMVDSYLNQLYKDKYEVKEYSNYLTEMSASEQVNVINYLIDQSRIEPLTDELMMDSSRFKESVDQLKGISEESFSLKEAKDELGLSRKYLIPLLELMDHKGITIRQENVRVWNS
ncbi:selenocysteine-specific translation elongation factor [Halalkalibacillus halophilus]|uniref:selenocysteine-specific translation elongation factor n=1 Tax=Halalkalibacillus halophilus TaxID=392827 RepID=UPI00041ECC9E|nr:selenocysteine-specific translation elongation factor [Halalkalibacillus halophilus]